MKKLLRILFLGVPALLLLAPHAMAEAWWKTRCWATVLRVPANVLDLVVNGAYNPNLENFTG